MDFWVTGRYLTETERLWRGSSESEEGGGGKRVFFSEQRQHSMRAPLERMRCPFCARWRMDRRGEGRDGGRENEGAREKNNEEERRRGGGGDFSVCIFHSKTFWQGRAHSMAGSGAILKSPTGSLREAGSQNRYISGLPGYFYFPPSTLFFPAFWQPAQNRRAGVFLFSCRNSGTVHTNTPTPFINR